MAAAVSSVTKAPTNPLSRRRCLQFSVRALFVLILLASVPLWCIRSLLKRKQILLERTRKQKQILGRFEQYGPRANFRNGYVVFLAFSCDPYVAGLGWKGPKGPSDAELVHLRKFEELEDLSLGCSNVTDAGLCHVGKLTTLRCLSLRDTRVSDAGLKDLFNLDQLRILTLRQTNVTADGVSSLQKALPNCEIRR
jgi:hypothetical protein